MNIPQEHWLETYRSLITLSLEGFRYLALINGGAVVALLAYLGDAGGNSASMLSCAFLGFLVGLVLCGLGLFAGYITQLWLLNEGDPVRTFYQSHRVPLYFAMFLYLGSIASFCAGAWSAVSAFEAIGAAQQTPLVDAGAPAYVQERATDCAPPPVESIEHAICLAKQLAEKPKPSWELRYEAIEEPAAWFVSFKPVGSVRGGAGDLRVNKDSGEITVVQLYK